MDLSAARGRLTAYRDYLYFKFCGVRTIYGSPTSPDNQILREIGPSFFESETVRLARRLKSLGEIALNDRSNWDLRLSETEKLAIDRFLGVPRNPQRWIALGAGTKMQAKDWEEERWIQLAEKLNCFASTHGLMLIGSADESERSEKIAKVWSGRSVNLCGKVTPRECAALLGEAEVFVGTRQRSNALSCRDEHTLLRHFFVPKFTWSVVPVR